MDRFLYDTDLRHEKSKVICYSICCPILKQCSRFTLWKRQNLFFEVFWEDKKGTLAWSGLKKIEVPEEVKLNGSRKKLFRKRRQHCLKVNFGKVILLEL